MRRRRSIFRTDPNASPLINTTPLIDVMLVMLVMFVITIPPPTHSVDVILPTGPVLPDKIFDENRVTIDTTDVIRWNGEAIDLAELGILVKQTSERPEPAALLLEPAEDVRLPVVVGVADDVRTRREEGEVLHDGWPDTRWSMPGVRQ